MGRFSGKSSAAAKANRDFIRINPYEIPEIALSVISNICQKNNTDDESMIIGNLREQLEKPVKGRNFYELIDEYRKDLFEIDFLHKIRSKLNEMVTELLAHENTNDTQVVVAGGFSAGKSSFLNNLTKAGDLLPTGIDPVSMVATYLYCNAGTKDVVVKGINLKDAVVQLDKDILKSIQHESKSKVYLASVLDKLFVEVPSDELDGFVFIDTPGYNNSDKKNDTNNRSDRETALSAIDHGNVLLWIIDAGAGTIPDKDLQVINEFLEKEEDRQVAVIFNKADKKGETEIAKIVNEAYKLLRNYGDSVIDVLGYSSQDGKIYYSANGYTMPKLLAALRDSGNGNSGIDRLKADIDTFFEDEIDFANAVVAECKKDRKKLIDEKNEAYKTLQSEKDGTKAYVDSIAEVLEDGYDEVLNAAQELESIGAEGINQWGDALEAIDDTNNSNWQTKDNIAELVRRYYNKRGKIVDRWNKAIEYKYYELDYRVEWVNKIKVQLDRIDDDLKERYEGLEEEISKLDADIKKFQSISEAMGNYRRVFEGTLHTSIKQFRMSAHKVQDVRVDFGQTTDVYNAIRSGKFSNFVNCFVKGVKMTDCNPEGYNPMTYAVKHGAYDMVRFLLDNNVSAEVNDNRGYNAFLTAVQSGQAHIIDMLMKSCPGIASSKSDKGESAVDLIDGKKYAKLIENQI